MTSAVPINRKCWCCDWPIGDILVPHRVPPERQYHHRRVEVTDIYIFRNKSFFSSRGFLDIEKSVLLELKGVKVIRSYRDFFQLIRDFFQLMIHFVFFI